MNFLSELFILRLIIFLKPIEKSLLSRGEFQKVDTILRLFNLFELSITREYIETVDWVLCVSIAPLELNHALEVFGDSNDSPAPFWLNNPAIKVHLS